MTSSFEDSADEEYNFATRVVCWQEFFALLLDIFAICAAIPCALSVVRLPQLVVDLASAAGDEDECAARSWGGGGAGCGAGAFVRLVNERARSNERARIKRA